MMSNARSEISENKPMRRMDLRVDIPETDNNTNSHLLLPIIDFNWHFQSVVSPGVTSAPLDHRESKLSSRGKAVVNVFEDDSHDSDASDDEDESRDEFFRVFKAFDENDDGLISKEEVSKLMSKLGYVMSDSDLELLMLTVDLNGDGCVDFDEFYALYRKLEEKSDAGEGEAEAEEEENLMEAFKMFDRNDDGFITAEELHVVLCKLGFVQGACSIAACKRMIQGVDSNGDGLVDFSEFKEMMLCRPSPRSYFASMIEVA